MDAINLMVLNKTVAKQFGIKKIADKTRWYLTFIPLAVFKRFDKGKHWFFLFKHKSIKAHKAIIHCIEVTVCGLRFNYSFSKAML